MNKLISSETKNIDEISQQKIDRMNTILHSPSTSEGENNTKALNEIKKANISKVEEKIGSQFCPKCNAEITLNSVITKRGRKKIYLHGQPFNSIITKCKICDTDFGLAGFLPYKKRQYAVNNNHQELAKLKKRKASKWARKKNRS